MKKYLIIILCAAVGAIIINYLLIAFGFDFNMIGKNKPNAYKIIIQKAAIMKALIAFNFIVN